jgi:hypothetical protein
VNGKPVTLRPAPPMPKIPEHKQESFLREVQASRERASFGAWWTAYQIALAARIARGDSATDAADYAHRAATAAEVDYRDKSTIMVKRIGMVYDK